MKKLSFICSVVICSAIIGILSSLSVTFIFVRAIKGNIEWGSIAEWVGSVGTIIGLFFVVYQVKSSEKQFIEQFKQNEKLFKEEHNALFKYYFRIITHKIEESDNGIIVRKISPVFKILAGNDGNVAGSFAFSGVCKTDFYESLDLRNSDNRDEVVNRAVDTRVGIAELQPDPMFQRIESKGTAEEWISLEEKDFQSYFPDDKHLTVVFMDTHGKLYSENIIIDYDRDLMKEDRISH